MQLPPGMLFGGMSPDVLALQQASAQFAPLSGGIQPRFFTGFEGSPLYNLGLPGYGAAMVANPWMSQQMSKVGMIPTGVTDQNVFDLMKQQQFMKMQQAMLSQASRADQENIVKSMRGAAAMAGVQWTPEHQQAAVNMAQNLSTVLPTLTPAMQDFLDAAGAGSSVMGYRMFQANRYRADPVTGRMGMSLGSSAQQSARLYDELFMRGNPADVAGFSAGQVGAMYDELNRRGMVAATSPSDIRDNARGIVDALRQAPTGRDILARAGRNVGVDPFKELSAGDLDKLTMDPAIAEKLRNLDVDKVKRSLQDYSHAVRAMADIFGAAGRPNAPMSELVGALDAFTGGRAAMMDPSRLALDVRKSYNMAQQLGIGLPQQIAFMQDTTAKLSQFGVESEFTGQVFQQSAAEFGALRGHVRPNFGGLTTEQMMANVRNMGAGALASVAGNRIGLLQRMDRMAGGFQAGTTAAAAMEAIRAGQTTFIDPTSGERRSVNMNNVQLQEALTGARNAKGEALGITARDVQQGLLDTEANREALHENNTLPLLRKLQGDVDSRRVLGSTIHSQLVDRLRAAGMSREDAEAAAAKAKDKIFEGLYSLTDEQKASPEARNRAITGLMGSALKGAGVADDVIGKVATDAGGMTMGSALNVTAKGLLGVNLATELNRNDPRKLADADRQSIQAEFASRMQGATESLARGGALRRFMTAIRNVDPNDPASARRAIMETFGVSADAVKDRMAKPIEDAARIMSDIQKNEAEIAQIKDPKQRDEAIKAQRGRYDALKHEMANLTKLGEEAGLSKPGALSDEEARKEQADVMSRDAQVKGRVGTRTKDREEMMAIWRSRNVMRERGKVREATDEEAGKAVDRIRDAGGSFGVETEEESEKVQKVLDKRAATAAAVKSTDVKQKEAAGAQAGVSRMELTGTLHVSADGSGKLNATAGSTHHVGSS